VVTVKALITNEQSAIMSNQNRVLFVKNRLARRLSVEWADLFLILDSGILVQSISG
jgi:hypothetical protein